MRHQFGSLGMLIFVQGAALGEPRTTPSASAISASQAMTVYRRLTSLSQLCGRTADSSEILVCGNHKASPYRLPLPREEANAGAGSEVDGRLSTMNERAGAGAAPCSVSGGGGFIGCSGKQLREIAASNR